MNSVFLSNLRYLDNVHTIYDIGAHHGSWTGQMSKYLPQTEFVMFEAYPEHTNIMAPEHFKYLKAPLYKEDDVEIDFYINTQTHHTTGNSFYKENTQVYDEGACIKLKTKKLDTAIAENSLLLPDAIKIDTQGAEYDILLGATEALKYAKLVMCEMSIYPYNKDGAKFSEVNDFLHEAGFVPVGIEEFHWNSNVLLQIDTVYLKREVNEKFFPRSQFLK